jgi:hypothetical protein
MFLFPAILGSIPEIVPRRAQVGPARRDKFVVTGIFMILWERMHSLHGFENCMLDLMDDRPEIHELAEHIVAYDLGIIRNMHRIAGGRIQALSFTEDWGTQSDLHVSPELWRRFFFPRYKRLFAAIHDCGWFVWMHSCGCITDIVPDLVDLGLDVLQFDQPDLHGIDTLASHQARGRITFWCPVDIQKTMVEGSVADVERYVRELVARLGSYGGGLVSKYYPQPELVGHTPEKTAAMCRAFRQYGADPQLLQARAEAASSHGNG